MLVVAVPLGLAFAADERRQLDLVESLNRDQLLGLFYGYMATGGSNLAGVIVMFIVVLLVYTFVEGISYVVRAVAFARQANRTLEA